MDGLTKDAQRVAAAGYAVYLEKRKRGIRKVDAKTIWMDEVLGRYIKNMSPRDYIDTVAGIETGTWLCCVLQRRVCAPRTNLSCTWRTVSKTALKAFLSS